MGGDSRAGRPPADVVQPDQSGAARLLIVLFTDIVGSTELVARQGDDQAREIRKMHDQLVRRQLAARGGTEIQTTGDGFLVTFNSVRSAILCACDIQRSQLEHNRARPDQALTLRVGLHAGEVSRRDDGLFGSAVNLAARVTAAAGAGEVLASDVIKQMAGRVADIKFRDRGHYWLKGFPDRWRLHEVIWSRETAATRPAKDAVEGSPEQSRRTPNNLPRRLTSFIGRAHELTALIQLLEPGKLLTLTGPGGCGKTRLALQVAGRSLAQYPDGVWLVELGPLLDPSLVPKAVASALGVAEQPAVPLMTTLTNHSSDRRMLLVLDNCEHLLGACASLVDRFLQSCPELLILATSREPLRLDGETVWRLPPLHQADGMQLFADRAAAVQPGFQLTDDSVEAVAAVCDRLDGMPLAIELAAARVPALSLDEMPSRLQQRFELLTSGARTAPRRQQTLRATLDWSYDLLTQSERTLLNRVSVFAGGWTMAAAEAICCDEDLPTEQVAALLLDLVEKSLVQHEGGRYGCLETVRQYGFERLTAGDDSHELRARHAAYFLAQAEDRAPGHLADWLDQMDAEIENVRAAIAWCIDQDADIGGRLALALTPLWDIRGYLNERRDYFDALLRQNIKDHRVRIQLQGNLAVAAYLADRQTTASVEGVDEALSMARTLDDHSTLIVALKYRALHAINENDWTTAQALLAEALSLCQEIGDRRQEMEVLYFLGAAAPETFKAKDAFERSLTLARELGRAEEPLMTLGFLAGIALHERDLDRSCSLIAEALRLGRRLHWRTMWQVLDVAACLLMALDRPEEGLQVAGAAQGTREFLGERPPVGSWVEFVEPFFHRARDSVGQEAAAQAWRRGRQRQHLEAVDFALGFLGHC